MEHTTQKPIRYIQCGLGFTGSGIVRLAMQKPQFQIVGAVDVDPAKVGRDVGRVINLPQDLGIPVCRTVTSALAISPADVIVHSTTSSLPAIMDELRECITAGVPVISTCEELAYPFRKYPELSAELDKLARDYRVAVLGAGINPGFAMDKLPLTIACACHDVSRVRVRRVVDASRRRIALQRRVGAGLTVEQFQAKSDIGEIAVPGMVESVAMLSDGLGIPVDRIDETIDPMLATERVRSQFLEVIPGQVRGIRQITRGLAGGDETIRLELEMYIGAPESLDEIHVTGKPDLYLSIPGGIHGDLATQAIIVNSVPELLKAEPGLRTTRDISMGFVPSQFAASARV